MRKIYQILGIMLLFFISNSVNAQSNKKNGSDVKKSVTAWDGMFVAGYVNDGAYMNLGGPSVKIIKKPVSLGLGMLPTLRIKEDKVVTGAKKNATVTPTLGFGFTFTYKHLALQLPFYYNPKTAAANGKWNVGAGIGYKF